MKNIHIHPTTQPSRLWIDTITGKLVLDKEPNALHSQHIYITSDEEIKEGDYCVDGNNIYGPYEDGDIATDKFIKIILTTDSQLIRYGVQAIDDEFLEWFVKNSSCEFVKVTKLDYLTNRQYRIYNLPQEEPKTGYVKSKTEFLGVEFTLKDGSKQFVPKQETLEEAAGKYANKELNNEVTSKVGNFYGFSSSFEAGANWQAERRYSDSIQFGTWLLSLDITSRGEGLYIDDKGNLLTVKDLFEQFKKK
jgi:hypothetical protein